MLIVPPDFRVDFLADVFRCRKASPVPIGFVERPTDPDRFAALLRRAAVDLDGAFCAEGRLLALFFTVSRPAELFFAATFLVALLVDAFRPEFFFAAAALRVAVFADDRLAKDLLLADLEPGRFVTMRAAGRNERRRPRFARGNLAAVTGEPG